jgi:hypothetical protein
MFMFAPMVTEDGQFGYVVLGPSDTRASADVALKPNQLQDFVDVLPDPLLAWR